jgi:hypothetical protein
MTARQTVNVDALKAASGRSDHGCRIFGRPRAVVGLSAWGRGPL